MQPSAQPSTIPSMQPTSRPSFQPTVAPSGQPTMVPTSPSAARSSRRSRVSVRPSRHPTAEPSIAPSTAQPSFAPTVKLVVASEVAQRIFIVPPPTVSNSASSGLPSSTISAPVSTTIALPAVTVPQASNTVAGSSLSLNIPRTILESGNSSLSPPAISVQLKVVEYDASVWSQRVVGSDSSFNSSHRSSNGTNWIAVTPPVLQSNILFIDAAVSSGGSDVVAYRPSFVANLSSLAGSTSSVGDYDNAAVVFTHNCVAGVQETVLFGCPGNVTQFNLTCYGSAAVQVVRSCPVLRLSCNLVSLADFRITDRTYCEVALTTRFYTICSCGNIGGGSDSDGRRLLQTARVVHYGHEYSRRLQTESSSSNGTASSSVSVGVMSEYVGTDVGSTVSFDRLTRQQQSSRCRICFVAVYLWWYLVSSRIAGLVCAVGSLSPQDEGRGEEATRGRK